jgi:probable rRNA maturation factor
MIKYELNEGRGILRLKKNLPRLEKIVSDEFKKSGVISVAEIGSGAMKKYNTRYRGKKKATDILTFVFPEGECLGEVVLLPEAVKKRAKERKYTLEKAALFLLIHGTLHIIGYGHKKKADAEKMEKKEGEILAKINL